MLKRGRIWLTLIIGGGIGIAAAAAMEAPPPLETSTEPKRISDNASTVSYPKVRVNVTYPENRDVIRLEAKTAATPAAAPVAPATSSSPLSTALASSSASGVGATGGDQVAGSTGGNSPAANSPAPDGTSADSAATTFTSTIEALRSNISGSATNASSAFPGGYLASSPSAATTGPSTPTPPGTASASSGDTDAAAVVTIDEFPGSHLETPPDQVLDTGERPVSEGLRYGSVTAGAAEVQTPNPPAIILESGEPVQEAVIISQVIDFEKRPPRTLATLYGEVISDADVARELWRRRGRETFDWLVGQGILRRELREYGLTVRGEEVEEQLERHLAGLRKAFPYLRRPDDLTRAAAGMPLEEYRDRTVWTELALRKIMRASLPPQEEDLRRYYAEIKANFIKPERVRISQLFIPPTPSVDAGGIPSEHDWRRAERSMREAETQLRMGSSFEEVARIYGSGTAAPRWVERGELLRELEGPVFSIEKGSLTTPIKTAMGYHVLKVLEHEERREPAFEEVRGEVSARYDEERFIRKGGEFLELLKRRAEEAGELIIDEVDLAEVEDSHQ